MSLLQQVQDGPKAPKPKKKKNDLRPEDLLDIVLNKLKTEREEQVAEAKAESEIEEAEEEEEVPVEEEANSEPEPVKPAQPKPAKPVIEQVTVPIPPASAPGINTEVPVSSTPLEDLLKSMLTTSGKHPTKWVFTIKRNASGFIESIEANAK